MLEVPSIFQDKICFSTYVYKVNGKKFWQNAPKSYNELTESYLSNSSGQDRIVVLTGRKNDITCLDIDDMSFWEKHKDLFENKTYTDESFSGKRHLYFKYNEKLKNKITGLFDILGERKTAMLGKPLNDLPITEMSEEIEQFLLDQLSDFENQEDTYLELIDLMDGSYVKTSRDWKAIGQNLKYMNATFDTWDLLSMKDKEGYKKNWSEGINCMKQIWDEEFLSRKDFNDKITLGKRRLMRLEKEGAESDQQVLDAHNELYKFAGPLREVNKASGRYIYHSIVGNSQRVKKFISKDLVRIAKRLKDEKTIIWLTNNGFIEELPKEINMIRKNHFDEDDKFYWQEFKQLLTKKGKKYYPNEVKSIIMLNISRVCVFYDTFVIIKKNSNEINSICSFKNFPNFPIDCEYIEEPNLLNMITIASPWMIPEIEFKFLETGFDFDYKRNDTFYASKKFLAKTGSKPSIELEFMLDFIKKILCSDDKEAYDYFMYWISFMWKFPNKKSCKAVLLYGAEGIGKGTIVDFLCTWVFGKYNCLPNLQYGDLVGHKNSNLMCKKLVCVNELASSRGEKIKDCEKIKTMITEEDIEINRMRMDLITVRNTFELIFMTNNENSLKIKPGDRRFFMLHCSDKKKENIEYFKELRETCFNEECASQFVTYLETLLETPDQFRLIKTPITDFKKRAMIQSEYDCNFYEEFAYNYGICDYTVKKIGSKDYRLYGRSDFYTCYSAWCKANGFQPKNSARFKEGLIKHKIVEEKQLKEFGRVYAVEHKEEDEEYMPESIKNLTLN